MDVSFDGIKVFSVTKARDREALGETITDWLDRNDVEVVDKRVVQSSDREYHCLTVTIFYRRK